VSKHTGSWDYHDDDCRCTIANPYCNRDGHVWSCCGACKEDSECSAPHMHPTYWSHPKFTETISGYKGMRPVYKTNEEIREIAPEAFAG
jgi:hypothetical protein